jgi:Ras-related protein Rab-8A
MAHARGHDMQIKLLTIGNSGASTRARARRCVNAELLLAKRGPLRPWGSPPPRAEPMPSPPLLAGVGKTCLLLRYANDSFSPTFITTIGIDFKIKTIEVDGKRIKLQVRALFTPACCARLSHPRLPAHSLTPLSFFLSLQIWDTAGQERFRTITTSYFRGAQGILLVYDVTDRNSFMCIKNWVDEIDRNADKHVNKILMGNKCDVEDSARAVSRAEGEALAKDYSMKFFETSAKKDIHVADAFECIARQVVERMGKEGGNVRPGKVELQDKNQKPAGGKKCC